jgi:hypothetical protein
MLALLLQVGLAATLPQTAAPGASDALVVLPAARDVVRRPENGMDTVSYRLEEPYPATPVLASIRSAVEKKGWRPLEEDFLNPGLASSHIRGWGTVIDGTVKPNQTVHSWHGQWGNGRGDILLYHLDYHCPLDDKHHSNELQVVAAFIPKAVYDRVKLEQEKARVKGPRTNSE